MTDRLMMNVSGRLRSAKRCAFGAWQRLVQAARPSCDRDVAWFVRPCGERVPTRYRHSHSETALVVLEPMVKGPVQAVCVRGSGGTVLKQEYGQSFWLGDREPVAVRVPLAYLPG